jgi:hypothetical protein
MRKTIIRLLFQSTRQRGHLALDSSEGHTISSGQHISFKLGDFWIPGTIESDGESSILVPDRGGWQARIPLQAGMTIQDENESEQEQMTGNKEAQFEAIYGPCPQFSEYKKGERIRYQIGAGIVSGVIAWVCAPQVVARKHIPTQYVVEPDGRDGFPDIISASDVIL